MDEPTSALTEHEVAHLFRIIKTLREQGKGIIYITHKMNELSEIADEVTVFRDGRYIGCMVGRTLFQEPSQRWLAGEIDDAGLIAAARHNFETLIDIWQAQRRQAQQ